MVYHFVTHIKWLVVSTPLKNISQLGLLFPIYGKMLQTTNQFYKNIYWTSGVPEQLTTVLRKYLNFTGLRNLFKDCVTTSEINTYHGVTIKLPWINHNICIYVYDMIIHNTYKKITPVCIYYVCIQIWYIYIYIYIYM